MTQDLVKTLYEYVEMNEIIDDYTILNLYYTLTCIEVGKFIWTVNGWTIAT